MKEYHKTLETLLSAPSREDRTGVGTRGIFGHTSRYDLRESFPLLTSKRIHWRSVVHELIWFLSGDTNTGYLNANGVTIWDEWADEDGNLGPIYGKQWRNFSGVDQIKNVVESLQEDPFSRRHIVSAWNPAEIDKMALPPCHVLFQFYVNGDELSCHLTQRSCDYFLGAPFNIASYSLLTCLVADFIGKKPGEFIHTVGDLHLYENHVTQAKELLSREPLFSPPRLIINPHEAPIRSLSSYTTDHISLRDYKYHPSIKAPVAV